MSERLDRVFFTDRDLGIRFPQILRAAGILVERHADHFAPETPDEEWLEAVGRRGWVAVTHDRRIRYKPNELAAVVRHRVALLVVVSAPSRAMAPFPDDDSHSDVSRWTKGAVHREGLSLDPGYRRSRHWRSGRPLVSQGAVAIFESLTPRADRAY